MPLVGDGTPSRGSMGREHIVKYGARNEVLATVRSVESDKVMSLVKFTVTKPCEMASVLTTESVKHLGLNPGDEVKLVVKAVHVLPVKE